ERARQRDGRGDRHHGQGEVERAEVAHEVLVVRTVDAYPVPAEAGEVVVERSRRERGPESDRDVPDAQHDQEDAHHPVTHAMPPAPRPRPAIPRARSGSAASTPWRP